MASRHAQRSRREWKKMKPGLSYVTALVVCLALFLQARAQAVGARGANEIFPTSGRAANLFSRARSQGTPTREGVIAYITNNDNVALISAAGGPGIRLTDDAQPLSGEQPEIRYCCVAWSPSGDRLAFERHVWSPDGLMSSLWVYHLADGMLGQVLAEPFNGFMWMPTGKAFLYGAAQPPGLSPLDPLPPDQIRGLWIVDLETGEQRELIPPESGRLLIRPRLSPAGRYVTFREGFAFEARAPLSAYDTITLDFLPWTAPFGDYTWAPDDSALIYDELLFMPAAGMRIWRRDMDSGMTSALTSESATYAALRPQMSPSGQYIAYEQVVPAPGSFQGERSLWIMSAAGGNDRPLGEGTYGPVAWSPDSQFLVYHRGEEPSYLQLWHLDDGRAGDLTEGKDPVWSPLDVSLPAVAEAAVTSEPMATMAGTAEPTPTTAATITPAPAATATTAATAVAAVAVTDTASNATAPPPAPGQVQAEAGEQGVDPDTRLAVIGLSTLAILLGGGMLLWLRRQRVQPSAVAGPPRCPRCGATHAPAIQFCPECGQKLD